MNPEEQQFLDDLDKKLWTAANKALPMLDAALPGLIDLIAEIPFNHGTLKARDIRGMDYDFGKEPASTHTRDQHPDLRADFIMANPPFNLSDRGGERWRCGVRLSGNLADSPAIRPVPARVPAVAFTED